MTAASLLAVGAPSSASALSLDVAVPVLNISTSVIVQPSQKASSSSSQRTAASSGAREVTVENSAQAHAATNAASAPQKPSFSSRGKDPLPTLPFVTPAIDSATEQSGSLPVEAVPTSRMSMSQTYAGVLQPTNRGWKIFGILWYWWVMDAGLVWLVVRVVLRTRKQVSANKIAS